MTERKPLSLPSATQDLRERRAQALHVLQEAAARPPQNDAPVAAPVRRPSPARDARPTGDQGSRENRGERWDRRDARPISDQGGRENRDDRRDRRDARPTGDQGGRPPSAAGAPRPARPASFAPARGPNTSRDAPRSAHDPHRSDLRPKHDATAGEQPSSAQRVPRASASADGIRLNKRMSDLGLCSRREGDAWIEQGWVSVNGEVGTVGQLVQLQDRIEVAPQARGQQAKLVTILLHKPMGFVSGQAEDGHQPAVALINPRSHWPADTSHHRFNFTQLQGLAPAGRLDIDSVGLLVLTQDGRVARQLIGEDSDIEKEYLVRVTYTPPNGSEVSTQVQTAFPAERLALLREGLSLDGEPLKPAEVTWQNPEQLRFVLKQGKKRQIRRMCEQVGLVVVGLKRIRMGKVVLGHLPVGQWRYLGAHENF